jgi:hypothetical protein
VVERRERRRPSQNKSKSPDHYQRELLKIVV